jgi:hypothetical protein
MYSVIGAREKSVGRGVKFFMASKVHSKSMAINLIQAEMFACDLHLLSV